MARIPKRKRATAIIEYPQGILLAVMRFMAPALPGGGVKAGETNLAAVIREVREETGLHVQNALLLFTHVGAANDHAVFWVHAAGEPHPCEEVDRLAYYRFDDPLRVSPETRDILRRFAHFRAEHPDCCPPPANSDG